MKSCRVGGENSGSHSKKQRRRKEEEEMKRAQRAASNRADNAISVSLGGSAQDLTVHRL